MLTALKFAARGIARSEGIPGLTHFAIRNQRITGFDGTLAMSNPLALSFNAAPSATSFMRAIEACEDGPALSITQESASRLVVRSGAFKAVVPCIEVTKVHKVEPSGHSISSAHLRAAFQALKPFITTDESKAALRGVLLNGGSAYATNNVAIAQYWIGTEFPVVANVPVNFVEEVLRVEEEPTTLQMSESSIAVHYADGRWIKCQLNSLEWPHVAGVLNSAWTDNLKPIAPALREACQKLGKYVGKSKGLTFFRGANVATAYEDDAPDIATVIVDAPNEGCYWTKFLNDVLQASTEADFSVYPKLVPFQHDRLRGVLLGVRE